MGRIRNKLRKRARARDLSMVILRSSLGDFSVKRKGT